MAVLSVKRYYFFLFRTYKNHSSSIFFVFFTDVDEEEFLRELGQQVFIQSCEGPLERAFRSLGGNLVEFLTTLDSVHDVLVQEGQEEGIQEGAHGGVPEEVQEGVQEGFLCSGRVVQTSDCLRMECSVAGPAAALLLAGSLQAVAAKLYDSAVSVVCTELDSTHYR